MVFIILLLSFLSACLTKTGSRAAVWGNGSTFIEFINISLAGISAAAQVVLS
jgi:hypothetical protein